jgi:hypothetical protein
MKKVRIPWDDGIVDELECYEFWYKGKVVRHPTLEAMNNYWYHWIMKHPNLKRNGRYSYDDKNE